MFDFYHLIILVYGVVRSICCVHLKIYHRGKFSKLRGSLSLLGLVCVQKRSTENAQFSRFPRLLMIETAN
jgi:hypothetical protein